MAGASRGGGGGGGDGDGTSGEALGQLQKRWPGREVVKGPAPVLPALAALAQHDAFGRPLATPGHGAEGRVLVRWAPVGASRAVELCGRAGDGVGGGGELDTTGRAAFRSTMGCLRRAVVQRNAAMAAAAAAAAEAAKVKQQAKKQKQPAREVS